MTSPFVLAVMQAMRGKLPKPPDKKEKREEAKTGDRVREQKSADEKRRET